MGNESSFLASTITLVKFLFGSYLSRELSLLVEKERERGRKKESRDNKDTYHERNVLGCETELGMNDVKKGRNEFLIWCPKATLRRK